MRTVVTGAAGFIGSHLSRALLDRGDEVVGLDNLLTGSLDNVADIFGRSGFSFVDYDVTNFVHIAGPVDAVLHFASPASPKDYLEHPIKTLKVGSLGTHKTLGLAKDKGARYLLASTACARSQATAGCTPSKCRNQARSSPAAASSPTTASPRTRVRSCASARRPATTSPSFGV